MKIAICQTRMFAGFEANYREIAYWISEGAACGAQLLAFPECALSGYHRELPRQVTSANLNDYITKIQELTEENRVEVMLGSPTMGKEDKVYNSYLHFRPNKPLQTTSKIGLTESEYRFFTPGAERSFFYSQGLKIGIIFCREVEDIAAIANSYKNEALDLLLWPSYIRWSIHPWNQDLTQLKDPENYLLLAKRLSEILGIPILNINCANTVNQPDINNMGGSLWFHQGNITDYMVMDQAAMKLYEL